MSEWCDYSSWYSCDPDPDGDFWGVEDRRARDYRAEAELDAIREGDRDYGDDYQ